MGLTKAIRNIAIIAHVDHGKTTLVDQILRQVHFARDNQVVPDLFLDSNALERERGITILSKNVSIVYNDVRMNIIDTPGHSDFGGQVERVLNLADGVLLLVDAADGPMPQTRFVLNKALRLGLKPLVVINKIDRPDARPQAVLERIFDLFLELGAHDHQLDFPVIYASGKEGWADESLDGPRSSVEPLLAAIVEHIPAPLEREGPVQMQVATIDYDTYVGRIGIGRVYRGTLRSDAPLQLIKNNGEQQPVRLKQLFVFEGIDRQEREAVACGDLCAVAGVEGIDVGDTLADATAPEALPPIVMDEPTISMVFSVNNSPLFGREGRWVSSRHVRERLFKETERDVALKVEETGEDSFKVNGRGVLHLSILIETMRREGYEMSIAPPRVITKVIDGILCEPIETLTVDVPGALCGKVMEMVGTRKGEMLHIDQTGKRTLLTFLIPTRGLIGLRGKLLSATGGESIIAHVYSHHGPQRDVAPPRRNGVLVSKGMGVAVSHAIDSLQQRGTFFIGPGEMCYEGMIVGEHNLESDLLINVQKGKMLTNMRSAGADRNAKIAPPTKFSLEEALEYVADDEQVEVTPQSIRLRKRFLTEHARRRLRSAARV